MTTRPIPPALQPYWQQLDTRFERAADVFEDCMRHALLRLSPTGIDDYLKGARFLGKLGRGVEPMLVYLEEWPELASLVGESSLEPLLDCVRTLWKSPNGKAIEPLLQCTPAVTRRLHTPEQFREFLRLVTELTRRTTRSIHGFQSSIPSPGLPEFLHQAPFLVSQLPMHGLWHWVDFGIRNHGDHPDRQRDYFGLRSADSRAVLQRERAGTLLADHERQLDLYLRSLWKDHDHFVPYSPGLAESTTHTPYFDDAGIRLPDALQDTGGIDGIDRYRAMLAHMAAHRRWSEALFADNFSPYQRLAIECLEDCRMDILAIRKFPGLARTLRALHPTPDEAACDPEKESAIRHRLTMLSRAILDNGHSYRNPDVLEFAERFHRCLHQSASSTREMADLAIAFVARTRRQSDQLARIHFLDTEVDYRDDNRHLWRYIEDGDEEEAFENRRASNNTEGPAGLPPRHYPEWDHATQSYRPDWTSVYESLHPQAEARDIDRLLEKHVALAKRLKRLLDLLKPQQKVRIRFQEEGSELDLDVAIRSLIDLKAGSNPDPRINMSHRTDGRNIAVMLLLDLSESLNETAHGGDQTLLQLSQEAVALLAWSVEQLGDPLAIGGFHSNTRHEVRYFHIKGYSEPWGDSVKGRLAALKAGYSTRMGAAMRHAAHYLESSRADKKLLLILTDGEPSDVDVRDPRSLIEDARKAVQELDEQGIYTYCINLDPNADSYVGDIFGNRYAVIDNVQGLPEKLPRLFMALTK